MNSAQKTAISVWIAAVAFIFVFFSNTGGGFGTGFVSALIYGIILFVPTLVVMTIWNDHRKK